MLKEVLAELIRLSDCDLARLRREVSHSLNVLEWLLRLAPKASEALQAAALLHDADRYVNARRKKEQDFFSYEDYKMAHARNCALIAKEVLGKIGRPDLAEETAETIAHHEVGDTPLSAILKDADSLSYFDSNIIDYYRERGAEKTKAKIAFMYKRMGKRARKLLQESEFAFKLLPALAALFLEITSTSP